MPREEGRSRDQVGEEGKTRRTQAMQRAGTTTDGDGPLERELLAGGSCGFAVEHVREETSCHALSALPFTLPSAAAAGGLTDLSFSLGKG